MSRLNLPCHSSDWERNLSRQSTELVLPTIKENYTQNTKTNPTTSCSLLRKVFNSRRETALQGGSVLAKSGRRCSADNIGLAYLQSLRRSRPAKLSNSVK